MKVRKIRDKAYEFQGVQGNYTINSSVYKRNEDETEQAFLKRAIPLFELEMKEIINRFTAQQDDVISNEWIDVERIV